MNVFQCDSNAIADWALSALQQEHGERRGTLEFRFVNPNETNIALADYNLAIVSKSTGESRCGFKLPANTLRVALAGEVFNGQVSCHPKVDVLLDRSLERPIRGRCKRVHYVQGLAFASRGDNVNYNLRGLCHVNMHYERRKRDVILSTSRVIKRSHHLADALVRGSLFYALSKNPGFTSSGTTFVKQLDDSFDQVSCPGNDLAMVACKKSFKFSIDMENTRELGYVSEKVFTGLLAGTIPVYFGAPDVSRYINEKRIIVCDVPVLALREMKNGKMFLFNESDTSPSSTNLLRYSYAFLKRELDACVAKIERVHSNDLVYYKMLEQPAFADPSICDREILDFGTGRELLEIIVS